MEILILLLISPAIFAQRYRKHVNPNDEPFLPIHPVYPYSPKLTKRGSDKEIGTLFKPELYAPRTDARDSYTSSYAGSPKDSYFPDGYGSYPRSPVTPYSSPYSSYYGNTLYGPYGSPYSAGPYPTNQYASSGHGSAPYPGYYPQSPYFYPDYYNQPFPYSYPDYLGPPGPPVGPPRNEPSSFNDENSTEKHGKPKSSKPKINESSSSSANDGPGNQYVEGNNLISQSYKDLAAQSSVQKTSNPYNQIVQISDIHLKNIPLPPTTYKVISVGGHPVGPNYPIPSSYARAQILEQAAAKQNLGQSLGQTFSHVNSGSQNSPSISSYLPYISAVGQQNSSGKPGDEDSYPPRSSPGGTNQDAGQYYFESLNPRGKSIEPHIYGSENYDLPEKESAQFLSESYNSPQDRMPSSNKNSASRPGYVDNQGEKGLETFPKAPSKYQNLPFAQKQPVTRVTFEQSHSTYIAPGKMNPSTSLEDAADQSSGPSHDQPPVAPNILFRPEANSFRLDQTPGVISYQNQNTRHSTPQAFTYHFTNLHPYTQGPQQQTKTNLEDVNFGTKQGNKG